MCFFFVGNQDKFLTNSSVQSKNTRNKHNLHRPIVNLNCFQKSASYSEIRIFNNLPRNIISLRNEKPQFKLALIFFFNMHTPFTLWMNFLHVQIICIADLSDCVDSYTLMILYVLYDLDMFYVLLFGDSLRDLWNVCVIYTGCPRRNVPNFGRVFLRLKYTDITQNTYFRSWTVTEIMAGEFWNFDSCYRLIDYQIHFKTGRNMWFL